MLPSQSSVTEVPRVPRTRDSRFWLSWFVALLVIVGLRLFVLNIHPIIGQDEVQIVDGGRTLLNPHSDWSITWFPQGGPALASEYGPLLQELGFRLSGSPIGPRTLSLVGAMLAATLLVAWLLSRGVIPRAAWLAGIAFALDPIFTESYGSARIDCWAFALCFGAAWLVRRPCGPAVRARADFLAGVLAALALAIWPTAPLLYPLLLTEFLVSGSVELTRKQRLASVTRRVTFAALGGIAAIVVLLAPVLGRLSAFVDSARQSVPLNVSAPDAGHSRLVTGMLGVFLPLSRAPFLIAAALLGALLTKERLLLVVTLGCVLFVAATRAYHMRDLYLLPYLIALATSVLVGMPKETRRTTARKAAGFLIAGAATWGFGLSAVVRPWVAWQHRDVRNPAILMAVAKAEIGPGRHTVLVRPYEFYYAGRQLGWRMFHLFARNDFKDPLYKTLLESVDYAIVNSSSLDSATLSVLERSGLKTMSVPPWPSPPAPVRILGIPAFSDVDRTYGPYTFFARTADRESKNQSTAVDSLGRQTPAREHR